jgi:uncharacterized protein
MVSVFLLLLIGLIAGIAGGMFGIGGGAIMVPAMVMLMSLDQKLATGTSIAAQILPIGILGAIVYYRNGNLNIKYALITAIGLVVGNLFGSLFANQPYISSETMKKLYGIFLLLLGCRYLLPELNINEIWQALSNFGLEILARIGKSQA